MKDKEKVIDSSRSTRYPKSRRDGIRCNKAGSSAKGGVKCRIECTDKRPGAAAEAAYENGKKRAGR